MSEPTSAAIDALARASRESGITPPPHEVNTGHVMARILLSHLPEGWRLLGPGEPGFMGKEDLEAHGYRWVSPQGYQALTERLALHLRRAIHDLIEDWEPEGPQMRYEQAKADLDLAEYITFKRQELARISDLQEAAFTMGKGLLADDQCRVCYHGPHAIPCTDIAHDPGPDGDVASVCGCTEYVDLEAQGRIIVWPE
jgi:hypothetical protein